LDPKPTEKSLAVVEPMPKITVLSPSDGSILVTDAAASPIAVNWRATAGADSGGGYAIYLWPLGRQRDKPITTAARPPVVVNLTAAGGYNLMVSSLDGMVASDTAVITLETITNTGTNAKANSSTNANANNHGSNPTHAKKPKVTRRLPP
jgi:hypothetical protein